MIFVSERNGRWVTFRGEKANVTRAFALKFRSTARLSPRPLNLRGNISEIISQPIGPKDSCKINHNGDVRYKRPALAARNFMLLLNQTLTSRNTSLVKLRLIICLPGNSPHRAAVQRQQQLVRRWKRCSMTPAGIMRLPVTTLKVASQEIWSIESSISLSSNIYWAWRESRPSLQ